MKKYFPWQANTKHAYARKYLKIEAINGDIFAEIWELSNNVFSWKYFIADQKGECQNLEAAKLNIEVRLERDGYKQVDEKLRPLR